MDGPNKSLRAWMARTLAVAAAVAVCPTGAFAQAFPTKPIHFVVPYPPGGASDITARLIGDKLSRVYGQPVIVENKPGANGNIALEYVARAQPDGHTILMGNNGPNANNASLYKKLPFDPIKSFAPITLTSFTPLILVTSPSLPVKNVKELVAYMKSSKDKTIVASGGIGAGTHLTAAMFGHTAGVGVEHVQYKGDVYTLNDLTAGHVKVAFVTILAAQPFLQSQKVRALGVTSKKRFSSLPDVPTLNESGLPGFDSVSWGGVFAPAGTPPAVIKSLNTEIVKILRMPDVAQKLSAVGAEVIGSSPEEFAAYLKSEISRWGEVIRANDITAE